MIQTTFSDLGRSQKQIKHRDIFSIKKQFKTEAKRIWRNKPSFIDEIKVDVEIKEKQKVMAQLRHSRNARQYAIGDVIYRCPAKVTLDVSKKALDLPEHKFRNIIGHEAIHLGYGRHDKYFRDLAKKHGIGVTISQMEGKGFRLQFKEGSRYKTYKVFKSKEEADDFFDKYLKRKTKKRWRLFY